MTVVVIGDANVDLEVRLPVGSGELVLAHPEPRLFGGGSAANTAAALARMGVPCRFVGAIGDDSFGRFALMTLEAAGVDVTSVTIADDQPTVTVIVVVPPDGERLIYVWPATGGAHGSLEVDRALAAVVGADWLHVSGICLRLSPAREAVLAAMDEAQSRDIPVSLDLNLRLENWGWRGGFRDVVQSAISRADVILGGATDEVGAITDHGDPVASALALAGTDRTVVARMGADGSVACRDGHTTVVPAFAVEVVDTVGAGDAFNAGFVCSRISGGSLREAMRMGSAVAACTISRAGARSHPTLTEIERMLDGGETYD